ncbi:hypothetical protein [Virgibacillus sp. DJP39]
MESKESALEETGDLLNPIKEGFTFKKIVELGDNIKGTREG